MKKEDVDKMTLQEALDYSINKLVEQGGQCMVESGCAYGNSKGQHCAVGWLLDEDNVKLMNYPGDVDGLVDVFKGDVPELIPLKRDVFQNFQNLHDSNYKKGTDSRAIYLDSLNRIHGIDITTNPNWKKWLEMGKWVRMDR
jgi:hypothetical protein